MYCNCRRTVTTTIHLVYSYIIIEYNCTNYYKMHWNLNVVLCVIVVDMTVQFAVGLVECYCIINRPLYIYVLGSNFHFGQVN